MIPVRLQLNNFMCYRGGVPPLSFEGIHVACICGDNGNGKSAIIDAITWALWGKARTRSDDDLVCSGQVETAVEFDFRVGGQLYRIIRRHARPRKASRTGQTTLDFLIGGEAGFKVISGETQTLTQAKIHDVLHMDYDTFTNSAFLRQGHADEFTTRRPAERKQVLASILGLGVYDELEDRARDLAREHEAEKGQLDSTLLEIQAELAQKEMIETEYEDARDKLSKLERSLTEQGYKLQELRQAFQLLESKSSQLKELDHHFLETGKSLRLWQEQADRHRGRIQQFEQVFARREEIEKSYQALTEARRLNESLDEKFRQVAALDNQKHQLEMAISRKSNAVQAERRLMQGRISELELTRQKLPRLKGELDNVQAQSAQLAKRAEVLREKDRLKEQLRAGLPHLESAIRTLVKEIAEIGEKLALLREETGAACPLCERELEAEHRHLIVAKFQHESRTKTSELEINQSELASRRAELARLEKEGAGTETALNRERAAVQARAGALQMEITEAQEADGKLEEAKSKLAALDDSLNKRDFAAAEQDALVELQGQLAALKYDPARHRQTRESVKALEKVEEPKRRLDEADRLFESETEALAKAEAAGRSQGDLLESLQKKRQTLAAELQDQYQVAAGLKQTQSEYDALTASQREGQEKLGRLKARLERCAELEVRKKEKGERRARVAREEGIYRELARAFGKSGIQAQLIETALPEIANEANRLLERMTDSRMHLKFDTQRGTKKGDVIETLDINISDELGYTRNYETFSGGEAFRIDFAIRIALSRLLAKRAGAPLPTLIIDEGFGTQDANGIEKLKEAISSIQDDFDKILVITHIDELKEAFPTRIEVIRGPEGSSFELS